MERKLSMQFIKQLLMIGVFAALSSNAFADTLTQPKNREEIGLEFYRSDIVALSKTGNNLLIVDGNYYYDRPRTMTVYDVKELKPVFSTPVSSGWEFDATLSGDGKRIVTSSAIYKEGDGAGYAVPEDLSLSIYEQNLEGFEPKYQWSLGNLLGLSYQDGELRIVGINHDASRILMRQYGYNSFAEKSYVFMPDFDKNALTSVVLDNDISFRAMSGDGYVLAGNLSRKHLELPDTAVLQLGSDYLQRVRLDSSDKGSFAQALSYDGKVVGGASTVDVETPQGVQSVIRPTVWYGENWSSSKMLLSDQVSLEAPIETSSFFLEQYDNNQNAIVSFLSADGRVAVVNGFSDGAHWMGQSNFSPEIWYGKNFDKYFRLIDQPSWDNSTTYRVTGMNSDGTVLSGRKMLWGGERFSDVLWRITYPSEDTNQSPPPEDTPTPPESTPIKPPVTEKGEPPTITMIDVNLTRKSFAQQSQHSMDVLQMQVDDLSRLQKSCMSSGDVVGNCFSVYTGRSRTGQLKQPYVGFSVARDFSPKFSAGIVVDYGMRNALPRNYQRGNSLGVGLYTQWQSKDWFFRSSVAMNHYKVGIRRDTLGDTEIGTGNSTLRSFGGSAIVGHRLRFDKHSELELYSGVRHTYVSQKAYVEKNIAFPASYNKVTMRDTSLVIGAQYKLSVSDKWSAQVLLEMGRSLQSQAPHYGVRQQYIGEWSYTPKLQKTRPLVNVGLEYKISPSKAVNLNAYYGKSILGNTSKGVNLSFTARF